MPHKLISMHKSALQAFRVTQFIPANINRAPYVAELIQSVGDWQ